jgi:hypothetical protein
MNIDGYWAEVRRLGLVLHNSDRPRIYYHVATGQFVYVDDPVPQTPEQRVDTIELIAEKLGFDRSQTN